MKKTVIVILVFVFTVLFSCAAAAAETEHEHVAGPVSIEDVKKPTCAEEGSYKEVTRCRICNEIMSSVDRTVAKTDDHIPAQLPEKENIVSPTCKDEGSYDSVFYCKVCGKELQRVKKIIPKSDYHISEYSLERTLSRAENGRTLVTFTDPAYEPLVKNGNLPESCVGKTIEAGKYISGDGKTRTCADGEGYCVICGELLYPAIPHTWDAGYFTDETPCFPWESTYTNTCLIQGCGETYGPATRTIRTYWYGDVDGDHEVTAEDARLALRASVGLEQYDADSRAFCCADYTCDKTITPEDARMILRAAVKLENPCSLWGTASVIRH